MFAIALDMPARNSFAFILIVLGLVSVLLMTWYILASKRINATYRHKIRPDKEAVSDAPGVKGENGQILKARQPRRWVLYAVGVPLSIFAIARQNDSIAIADYLETVRRKRGLLVRPPANLKLRDCLASK